MSFQQSPKSHPRGPNMLGNTLDEGPLDGYVGSPGLGLHSGSGVKGLGLGFRVLAA